MHSSLLKVLDEGFNEDLMSITVFCFVFLFFNVSRVPLFLVLVGGDFNEGFDIFCYLIVSITILLQKISQQFLQLCGFVECNFLVLTSMADDL